MLSQLELPRKDSKFVSAGPGRAHRMGNWNRGAAPGEPAGAMGGQQKYIGSPLDKVLPRGTLPAAAGGVKGNQAGQIRQTRGDAGGRATATRMPPGEAPGVGAAWHAKGVSNRWHPTQWRSPSTACQCRIVWFAPLWVRPPAPSKFSKPLFHLQYRSPAKPQPSSSGRLLVGHSPGCWRGLTSGL